MSDGEEKASDRKARLIRKDGEAIELEGGDLTVGRSKNSSLSLEEEEVSWEHCLFNFDEKRSGWRVIDLNSSNGTYVNERRITGPTFLNDGDHIDMGKTRLTFEGAGIGASAAQSRNMRKVTRVKSEVATCWLLLLDVVGSTRMSQQLKPEDLNAKVRAWAKGCDAIIEQNGGVVNEYLGDGLLAFWRSDRVEPKAVAATLVGLEEYRRSGSLLDFRVVLHCGTIRIGGGVSSGKEGLHGQDVNFVFKAEKVLGGGRGRLFISEQAAGALTGAAELQPCEEVEVPGFQVKRRFFCFSR